MEDPFSRDKFSYDEQADAYICPAGEILKLLGVRRTRGVKVRVYRCAACPNCPQQRLCVHHGQRRTLKISQTERFRDAMRAKLARPEGRRKYKQRQATVEPVIGHLKCVLGWRQSLLRGLDKVRGEFFLLACAYNLRKIVSIMSKSPPPLRIGATN